MFYSNKCTHTHTHTHTHRRLRLKCDVTCAETILRLSAKRTSPFKSAGGGVSSVDCWQPRCAPSTVAMLDTPCSELVWRVLATHCIRQFPLHFTYRASPCAIRFQLNSNARYTMFRGSVKDTGCPLHWPVPSSLPVPCTTVCYHISTGLQPNLCTIFRELWYCVW